MIYSLSVSPFFPTCVTQNNVSQTVLQWRILGTVFVGFFTTFYLFASLTPDAIT